MDGDEGEALMRWAVWTGQHALAVFLAVLFAALTLAAFGWWALQRYVVPRARSALAPGIRLALCVGTGFAVIVIGAAVLAESAEAVDAQAVAGLADQALTDALRASVPVSALRVFAVVTHAADTFTLIGLGAAVAVGLVAAGHRWLVLGWLVALTGNGALTRVLKNVFERVRPFHDDGLVTAEGFSFPSGHSSGSVVAFGMLAYIGLRVLPRRWHLAVLLGAVAAALTVGASRVFLRVHFASDVLAGFASGSAWLSVCIGSIELARQYPRRLPPSRSEASPEHGAGP